MSVTATITTSYASEGPAFSSTKSVSGKTETRFSLAVIEGTPQVEAFVHKTAGIKALVFKSDKACTIVSDGGPTTLTLAAGGSLIYDGSGTNPLPSDGTTLTFSATGTGETANITGRVLQTPE